VTAGEGIEKVGEALPKVQGIKELGREAAAERIDGEGKR
jgi:hypothetical protein